MNEEIETVEDLLEEVEIQALETLDSCLDMLKITYLENKENPTKESQELFNDAQTELKTLLQEYAGENEELIEEAFEELFDEVKNNL